MIAGPRYDYSVFGGVLRTTLALPELHPAPGFEDATWTLAVHDGLTAPQLSFSWSAEEDVAGGVSVRLERHEDGRSRLTYSDTGIFDISASGRLIDWYRAPGAREELARTDILGRVLSLAACSDGVLMLHASAVALGGEVAGFLAPKFYGKSTLACALTDAGASLVTDDALAVRAAHRVECAPGVPAIRLRRESAAHLRGGRLSDGLDASDGRHVERRDVGEIMTEWLPLGALYVLNPRSGEAMATAAARTRLLGAEAAMALVRFAKLGGLLRGPLAVDYLGTAAEIAGRIPVYALECVRDLEQLGDVAAEITRWHRGAEQRTLQ